MHTDNSEVKSRKFPAQLGHKTMDKSCQVYGNFYIGNHNMIVGRWAYIAVYVKEKTLKPACRAYRRQYVGQELSESTSVEIVDFEVNEAGSPLVLDSGQFTAVYKDMRDSESRFLRVPHLKRGVKGIV